MTPRSHNSSRSRPCSWLVTRPRTKPPEVRGRGPKCSWVVSCYIFRYDLLNHHFPLVSRLPSRCAAIANRWLAKLRVPPTPRVLPRSGIPPSAMTDSDRAVFGSETTDTAVRTPNCAIGLGAPRSPVTTGRSLANHLQVGGHAAVRTNDAPASNGGHCLPRQFK